MPRRQVSFQRMTYVGDYCGAGPMNVVSAIDWQGPPLQAAALATFPSKRSSRSRNRSPVGGEDLGIDAVQAQTFRWRQSQRKEAVVSLVLHKQPVRVA